MTVESALNLKTLVRVESYTDNDTGEIVRFIPVDENGERDLTRTETFMGMADVGVQGGAGKVRITFPIPSPNLGNALFIFGHALKVEVERRNKVAAAAAAEPKIEIATALPPPPSPSAA
jgi:hypothetical protein